MVPICSIARQAQSCVILLLFHHGCGTQKGEKRGEKRKKKKEKRKKTGRNSKSFFPQLPAALSHSVATEATAQLLRRLLFTQATVALPPSSLIPSGYAPV
jgi:hypothetical protein